MKGASSQALTVLLQQGIAQHQSGNTAAAELAYQQVLDALPKQPDALHLMGVCRHQNGDHEAAVEFIQQSVKRNPKNPDAYSNLGAALNALGKTDEAATCFQKAAKLNPKLLDAHVNLAILSARRGADDQAIRSYRTAHKLNPAEPKYMLRLAELFLKREKFSDAADWFQRYLAIKTDDADAYNNAAYACQQLERWDEATAHYRQAVTLDPTKPEFANNLANILRRTGMVEEAETIFEAVLGMDPSRWEDRSHYAGALFNCGMLDKALDLYESLARERSDDAELHQNFGRALLWAGKYVDAEAPFRKTVQLDPHLHSAWIHLAHCLLHQRKIDDAIEALSAIPEQSNNYLAACLDLCLVYAGSDRLDQACEAARKVVAHPDFKPSMYVKPYTVFREACALEDIAQLPGSIADVDDSSLMTWANGFLELLVGADTNEQIGNLANLHRRWGAGLVKRIAGDVLPAVELGTRQGKIKLGFLSSDLKRHSVSRFVLPLFQNYDPDAFEIFCYSPEDAPDDEVQCKIKDLVTEFRVLGDRGHRAAAEMIRDDAIDVLFELNGFTAKSRLPVMAFKPAPVQVYWLGYPFTTGFEEIDYILLDRDTVPVESGWLVEKPLLMPDSWVCYEPFETTQPWRDPPVARNGYVTFGTLNNPYKFTRAGISNWARVMQAVPGSRYLFVHPEFKSATIAENIKREFGRNGVTEDRLDFVNNRQSEISHFTYYDEIDISLDTTPLTGGTSTHDALWMGVPVVTLVGPALHQRLSNSILRRLDLEDLCTETPDQFVAAAVNLANQTDRLTSLRRDLRARMQASPLCQADDFAQSFQKLMMDLVARHGLR
jgi:predicted O-linked N-acetylglucosamine transferase (SPINDLY family)